MNDQDTVWHKTKNNIKSDRDDLLFEETAVSTRLFAALSHLEGQF
jgi:hypothetical protein